MKRNQRCCKALPGVIWVAALLVPGTGFAREDESKLFDESFSEEAFFRLEEEAVTIASKHAQSTREAPASIAVLTADDISRYGFRDLGDLLRSVAGWFVSDGRDLVYAGVRGILLKGDANTRILVLIDGHTWNEQWSSSSSIDESLGIDVSAIQRVEILQGPSSTLYGPNAFLGVINIVTRSGADAPSMQAQLDLGSFGRSRLSAAKNGKAGELQYGVRASLIGETGRYLFFPERAESSESGGYTSPETDRLRAAQASMRLQLKGFKLSALFSDRLKHIPTAPFDTVLDDDRTQYRQTRWFVEGRLDQPLGKRADLMARAYYDGYIFQDWLWTNGETAEESPYLFRDLGRATWFGAETQLGLTLVDSSSLRDVLYVGLQGDRIATRSEAFVAGETNPDEPAVLEDLIDIPIDVVAGGAYLQNELQIAQTFSFVAGVRYDYHSAFIDNTALSQNLSPRAALILRTRSDSTFKLIYSQGFRNPSIYEAFFEDDVDIAPNPALAPETIRNVELAYEYRYRKLLRLSLANYYFRASGLLKQETVCYDPATMTGTPGTAEDCPDTVREQFQNVSQVDGLGSELTVHASFPFGLEARATLAAQKATQQVGTAEEALLNSPTVVSNLLASYPLVKDKAFLSAQIHFVSERAAGLNAEGGLETVPPYVLANLVFTTRDVVKGLDVSAGVYNALDYRYRDVAVSEKIVVDRTDTPVLAIPMDGRTFAMRLTWRY